MADADDSAGDGFPADTSPERPDEILTTRHFDAPRALVYEAWTTPEHVAAWWGPDGFTITTVHREFTVGGTWTFTMHGPDGTDYPNEVRYTEVVPARRLAYEHGDGQAGKPPHFHVVVTFTDDRGGTLLTMRARFPSAAARQFVAENFKAVAGARQTIERLAGYVETLRQAAAR